jgi:hypothetical protein
MADLSLFSNEQIAALLSALPDPAFILTRSGRYAAIFGGTDSRYYHDGSSLVGKYISDVLNDEKAAWFLAQINIALASRGLHVAEYPLAADDVKGVSGAGPTEPIWFEGRCSRSPTRCWAKMRCCGSPAISPPARSWKRCCACKAKLTP